MAQQQKQALESSQPAGDENEPTKPIAQPEEEVSETDDSEADLMDMLNSRRLGEDPYSVIDTKLSQIILIEKQMMEEWRKQ
jgi:hypothetical protein